MYILYLIAGIFLIIGIGIRFFKWYFLISGYNTMSKEKKENVDIEKLGKLMGNFSIIIGILFIIAAIAQNQGNGLLTSISLFSIFPLTVILIIYAQKYDKNRANKAEAKVSLGIMIFVGLLVFGIVLYSAKGPKIEVGNDRITIKGMYGATIEKDDIVELSIEESLPRILRRTNGVDLVYILRGRFLLEDIGNAVLFINVNSSPYIVIKTEDKSYIINYKDSNKTMELYNELKVMDS